MVQNDVNRSEKHSPVALRMEAARPLTDDIRENWLNKLKDKNEGMVVDGRDGSRGLDTSHCLSALETQ